MRIYLFVIFTLQCYTSIGAHPKLTIDEFFNATSFQSVSLSPNGRHLLVYTRKPAWDSNSYDNSLWLYETDGSKKELITTQYAVFMEPKWSPSGDWFFYYATPSTLTWSDSDSSLYFAAQSTESTEDADRLYEAEWKDVIQYRRRKPNYGSVIQRIDIKRKHGKLSVKIHCIKHLDFIVTELLFVPSEHKIVCISYSPIIETLSEIELYAKDLRGSSSLIRLTNNQLLENSLKLSAD
ncbi:unnamed protein product, partial [Rotaria magnacalcarata]